MYHVVIQKSRIPPWLKGKSPSATAVCEVSLVPLTLLDCINESVPISRLIHQSATFSVNILSVDQQVVASACAEKLTGEDRFSFGRWTRQYEGHRVLDGAQAAILCRQGLRLPAGSHTVFIAQVARVIQSDAVQPLVYLNRNNVMYLSPVPA